MRLRLKFSGDNSICCLRLAKDDIYLNTFYIDCVVKHIYVEGRLLRSELL